jgi:putative restriction endonuclease
MRRRIERYRRIPPRGEDYQIGCILLAQPFFFPEEKWIPTPEDWSRNIVQGKSYDLSSGIGEGLWEQIQLRLGGNELFAEREAVLETKERYGSPLMVLPRLGQGSFRVMVTDAYRRRCAVTQERTLPALEAGHIKPFQESGPHKISNGILLRSDIHRLLDTGYVTITPDYRFEVSRRVREEYENGRDYYALNGRQLLLPVMKEFRPGREFISWHNENRFLG